MNNDEELVKAMLRGDQAAFQRFFESHAGRLVAFAARRSDLGASAIEDVVQLTMINAMRNLRGFRGEATLFTWLCQICRSQLADARRKVERQPRLESYDTSVESKDPAVVVQLTDFRDPLDECESDSTRSAVRRAVNRLAPHYARILEMRFGDDLTVPEIARTLGVSVDAAESLLTRARKAFREEWLQTGGDADPSDMAASSRRPSQ